MTEATRAPVLLITPDQVDRYRRDGYLAVRALFSTEEVLCWSAECDRLWRTMDSVADATRIQFRGQLEGGQIADRLDPLVDVSPMFHRLTRDTRILRSIAALLGTDGALMKAKLIAKRPGTMGYDMHQDYPYWAHMGIPADDLLTVQVSIDAADRSNGAIEMFPGLHHEWLESPADAPMDVDEGKVDLSRWHLVEAAPGDILLFHSLTPHRSGPNRSLRNRRAVFLTYTVARHGDTYRRYHESTGLRT